MKVSSIIQGKFQPRLSYDHQKLQELTESIRESGVIYPILVRENIQSGALIPQQYELIAGERRLKAVKSLGLQEIPAIIKRADDVEAAKMALIENLQRQELTAIEEALAYQRLQREFEMTHEQVAQAVGKERVTVTNTLRLLQLPKSIQEAVGDGALAMAHARALLGLPTESLQHKLAAMIRERGLSVRRVEQLVRQWASKGPKRSAHRDPNLAAAEESLRQRLGTKVAIHMGRKRGWIRIECFSTEDLTRIVEIVRGRG
ncbi:MAG: ParB/RepB/Spo0J family partition protein [Candidatus Omnitrophica bacterium]|nr:ParB/RepB/Spo0J family partition protein [Candidatus Omnitrophota bacterium]